MKISLTTAKQRSFCYPQSIGLDSWIATCGQCDTSGPIHRAKRDASAEARLHNATAHPDALEAPRAQVAA
jgi:hypothetical protein